MKPFKQQPILPYFNFDIGLVEYTRPTKYETIVKNYSIYSYNYWIGVKKRQREYLLNKGRENY